MSSPLKTYAPEHASLNKVFWLCRQNSLEGWSLYNGKKVTTAKRRFQDFWSNYRSVAHLWAAWQIEQQQGEQEALFALLQDDEKLARFLGTAARLFLFAVLQVEGMDLPIINLGPDPWIVAPDGLPDMKIMPPPPTEWILRVLGEYRAPADQK